LAAPWVTTERPLRPTKGFPVSPRFLHNPLPEFTRALSNKYRSARKYAKPNRVKIGAAAAAAIATAGIAASVTTSATTASAANDVNPASRVAASHSPARHQAASHAATKAHATAASHSATAAHSTAPAKSAPAKTAPAKPAPRHTPAPAKKAAQAKNAAPAHNAAHAHKAAPKHRAAPKHKAAPKHAAPKHKAAPRHDYRIYDSVTPSSLPHHNEIAIYSNGAYAAPRSAAAGRPMLYIDTNGSNPRASVLDVEPGDASPTQAAAWARARLSADPHALARIYTMRSEWPATKAAVDALPASMRSRVRWWIADPTGVPHIVHGSDATQWYWGSGFDISTATPKFG
jgi:hypothetical protein